MDAATLESRCGAESPHHWMNSMPAVTATAAGSSQDHPGLVIRFIPETEILIRSLRLETGRGKGSETACWRARLRTEPQPILLGTLIGGRKPYLNNLLIRSLARLKAGYVTDSNRRAA